ncbi:MAG: LysR family transcriptional regulator [Hyphomicrobiaceae bacterium]|nr:LysR family transcriptional regulator [Hyphomicrobiaceae bacterium]
MNLRQLEIFQAVMRAKSVSGAARLLNVSQPTVSNVLKHTETSLGLSLFERKGSRLIATPEAQRLFPEVEKVFSSVDACQRVVSTLSGGSANSVALASSSTLVQAHLVDAIARFRTSRSNIDVSVLTCSTDEVLSSVLRQQVDIGVAYALPGFAAAEAITIGHTQVCALVHQDDPLSQKASLRLSDLVGRPLISYRNETPLGVLLRQEMRDQKVDLPISIRASCLDAYMLVANGAGVALVDSMITKCRFYDSVVTRTLEPAISIDIRILTAPGRARSQVEREMIDHIIYTFNLPDEPRVT